MNAASKAMLQPIVVALTVVCFLLLLQTTLNMGSRVYYINLVAQLALILMAIIVTLRDMWAKQHPWITISAFVLIGTIAMAAAVRQNELALKDAAEAQSRLTETGTKLAEAETKLSDSLKAIVTQTGEIARVQDLNTKLQNKLLDQSGQLMDSSKQITGLSKEAITTSTGGDSFCYMDLSATIPYFIHVGKHPLYNVNVSITDFTKLDRLFTPEGNQIEPPWTYEIPLGDLPSGSQRLTNDHLVKWGIGIPRQQDFRVFFEARNGFWYEDLQFQVDNDHTWRKALRVFRGRVSQGHSLILTLIDKEYPTQNPIWHQ